MRPLPNLAIILAAGTTLGACSYGYGGYGGGYGGVSVGVSSGGYYDPYYDDWGYYRSNPYWGWYDNYYYPGVGIYVYDRYRRPHRWTDSHQRYWTSRQSYWRGRDDFRQSRREMRENWRDFRRDRRGQVRREGVPRRENRSD